jgi:hypothetical protein
VVEYDNDSNEAADGETFTSDAFQIDESEEITKIHLLSV